MVHNITILGGAGKKKGTPGFGAITTTAMGTAQEIMRRLAWTFIAIFVISQRTSARQAWAQEDDSRSPNKELAQMLALIAQILMASTYPLEAEEAELLKCRRHGK